MPLAPKQKRCRLTRTNQNRSFEEVQVYWSLESNKYGLGGEG